MDADPERNEGAEPPKRQDIDFKDIVAFMESVAPNWKCVVCKTDSMTVFGTQQDGTDPANITFNFKEQSLFAFRSFSLHCSKCGHIYLFDVVPFFDWMASRNPSA